MEGELNVEGGWGMVGGNHPPYEFFGHFGQAGWVAPLPAFGHPSLIKEGSIDIVGLWTS